jgi:Asp-tRNA(Asn)/Glu-tRNA(Gln) amidotransferase A subunit family amidase
MPLERVPGYSMKMGSRAWWCLLECLISAITLVVKLIAAKAIEAKAMQKQLPNKNQAASDISRRTLIKNTATMAAISASPFSLANAMQNQGSSELTWMPAWQLVAAIAHKKLSPVEVVTHFLNRIDRLDPILHAYITVDHAGAIAQAKSAEKAVMSGASLGPLHGLPISIKDLYMTKGLRTTQGSLIYKDTVPDVDEILVERLRNAGAIILGKTNTSEFATFPRTKSLLAGECVNPWNTAHISGASSGGAGAAVAAGMSCFAIGSDGGGSTRIPSCFNGVFGFQPSAGRLAVRKPSVSPMSSAGPMALHVRDAAMILETVCGQDPRDPSAIEQPSPKFVAQLDDGIKDFRIAWSKDFGAIPIIEPKVIQQVEASVKILSEAGAHIESPELIFPDRDAWAVFLALNEIAHHRGSRLLEFNEKQAALLTPPTQRMLAQVKATQPMSAEQQRKTFELRAKVYRWTETVFAKHDLICTPTLGIVAPEIPEGEWDQPYTNPYYANHISTCYTYVANILGLPACSVPCGFVDGLPVGLQIIGRRFDDVKVMRAAEAFFKLQPWTDKHPAIAL